MVWRVDQQLNTDIKKQNLDFSFKTLKIQVARFSEHFIACLSFPSLASDKSNTSYDQHQAPTVFRIHVKLN